jgi:hypothetical protein
MDAEKFIHPDSSNTYSGMQLIKLHGSVNWIRNRDRDIEEVEFCFRLLGKIERMNS